MVSGPTDRRDTSYSFESTIQTTSVPQGSQPSNYKQISSNSELTFNKKIVGQVGKQLSKESKDISIEKTAFLLQRAQSREEWEQILRHCGSYRSWSEGYIVPQFANDNNPPYKVAKVIDDGQGFRAMLLENIAKNSTPILLFRATLPPWSNATLQQKLETVMDDLHKDIGTRGVERNEGAVERVMRDSCKKHGKLHLAGYSLGGCYAQIFTAKFPALVESCTIDSAPGVGKKVVDDFKLNCAKSNANPIIVESRVEGDIVPLCGGAHLPATKTYYFKPPSLFDKVTAHFYRGFGRTRAGVSQIKSMSNAERLASSVIENIRIVVGDILKVHRSIRNSSY
jgi:hypothetical protein